MNDTQWFIRLGRDEVGPMAFSELGLLAQQGGVRPETPVSSDRIVWQDSATVEGLRFGQRPSADGISAPVTNEWLRVGKSQMRTILNDLRELDYREEVIPIDQKELANLIKDRVFWFAALLGIVPLMIGTLAEPKVQLVVFALFFAGVWGVLFRSAILRHDTSWKVLLPSLFFTGLFGTATAGAIENVLFPLVARGYVTALLGFVLVVGMCEELVKVVPVIGYLLWKRSAANPMTIILVGVFSGLGFAAFENLVYSQLSISRAAEATVAAGAEGLSVGVQEAMVIAMLRSLSSVFCHGIWGGIFAYFLATASLQHRRWGALFLVGLVVAAVLHGIYDWFALVQPTLAALTAALSFVLFCSYVARARTMAAAKATPRTLGETS